MMEFAFSELLSREDLLRILQEQRQLNIPEIEKLSDNELQRIFKRFAMPLAKREQKFGRHKRCEQKGAYAPMEVDEPMETNETAEIAYLNILIKDKSISFTEKRHFDYEDDDSLSSATKRIKITWP